MPILPFSEWRPDVSPYMAAASPIIQNVVPRADGYGPFPGLVDFTQAMPAACRFWGLPAVRVRRSRMVSTGC